MRLAILKKTTLIFGGIEDVYALFTVTELTNALSCYIEGNISLSGLRVFLAAREMLGIREAAAKKRATRHDKRELMVCYRRDELEALTGLSARSIGKALHELQDLSLLRFSAQKIDFEKAPLESARDLLQVLRGGRSEKRPVPIPRSILKHLAHERSGSLILTALAYCIRGLTLTREGEIKTSGTLKVSFIASIFGISERSVLYSREKLIKEDIITGDDTQKQWKLNRFGAFFEINVNKKDSKRVIHREGSGGAFSCPAAERVPVENSLSTSHKIAPQGTKNCSHFAPPIRDKKPYYVNRNQKPQVSPKPRSGVLMKQTGEGEPNIRNVSFEDLLSFSRTETLYRQACRIGLLNQSEASKLNFIAAAVHAKNIKEGDPVRVFMSIIRRGLFHHVTQAEEERARAAIRKYRDNVESVSKELMQLVA